jgi:hypothetical protein
MEIMPEGKRMLSIKADRDWGDREKFGRDKQAR